MSTRNPMNKRSQAQQSGEMTGFTRKSAGSAKPARAAASSVRVVPASAKEKFNLDNIFSAITDNLPEAPAWFDKDVFTDKSLRFFASEIIREKILLYYSQEIPYSCEVSIESFKEGSERYDISAVIYVMRESQKGIVIGKGGQALKKVGTKARLDMEEFFQKKVFLSLFVKVDPDWRENKKELRRFGYENGA